VRERREEKRRGEIEFLVNTKIFSTYDQFFANLKYMKA
jgi:hypothetical protein